MSCGCKEVPEPRLRVNVNVKTSITARNVIEDARAEFERQTRQLIRDLEGQPDIVREQVIRAEMRRFSRERYNLTRGAVLDLLRAAL
jgi:hypothetical protein